MRVRLAGLLLVILIGLAASSASTEASCNYISRSCSTGNGGIGTFGPGSTANIDISKTVSGIATPGSNISYLVGVTNIGAIAAQSVVLHDSTPANTVFTSLTHPTGWTCSTPAIGGTGAITCNASSLPKGPTASFTLTVSIGLGTPDSTVISNTANATTISIDSNPTNNAASASILVSATGSFPLLAIDAPAPGAVAQPFVIFGWAIDDKATVTTGVDSVSVVAYPTNSGGVSTGAPPISLGSAAYGGARPDVGAAFGAQFTNSSYYMVASGLSSGYYVLVVTAHSTISGATFSATRLIQV